VSYTPGQSKRTTKPGPPPIVVGIPAAAMDRKAMITDGVSKAIDDMHTHPLKRLAREMTRHPGLQDLAREVRTAMGEGGDNGGE